MAGLPWLKLETGFSRHPKTLELCRLTEDTNAGMYMIRLFEHCAEFAQDGRIPAAEVEVAAGWKRSRSAGKLLSQLLRVGFLEASGDLVIVHGWEFKNGAHVRKWLKDNTRPNASRRNPDTTPSKPPAGFGMESRVEKSREDKSTTTLAPTARKPTDPRFAPLKAAWEAEYLAARKAEYHWGGPADAAGIHRVIAIPVDDFRARAQRGLRAQGFLCCATVAKLTSNEVWNQLAGVAPTAPSKQRAIAGVSDFTKPENQSW